MLAPSEDEVVGTMSLASLTDAVAVAREQWGAQHRVFNVETFFKMVALFLKCSKHFRTHFIIAHHGKISCCSTIQVWVENFRTSAFALKKKPPGSVHTVHLP